MRTPIKKPPQTTPAAGPSERLAVSPTWCSSSSLRDPVRRILHSTCPRSKFTLGPDNDVREREADRTADAVMGISEEETALGPIAEKEIVSTPAFGEGEEGAPLGGDTEAKVRALQGGGVPLGEAERAFFEPRFGVDFSRVRIHTGSSAEEAARDMGARAFAVGSDIGFGAGSYAPETVEGQRLMAHELAHVVQQQVGGAIRRTPDFTQQLRYRGRYRYEGSGDFEPALFEPDLREHLRAWLVEHLSVLTVEEPFDEITGRLLAAFRQAHQELGERAALERGRSVTYGARISVEGAAISISDVTINDQSWTPVPEVPVETPLDPELEGWWQALMSSFTSFWGDGVEEFHVLFARGPGRALQFRSWQRHEVTEGTRRLPSPQRATDAFGGELRASLQAAFGFPVQDQELWQMTVRREGMGWTLVRSGIVAAPPPPGRGDEVILDRRRLYGEIFQRWREQLEEVGVAIAGFALEELILLVVTGAVFRILGFALGRLPVLRRLLSMRRFREIFEGIERMGRGEADELAALMRRAERGEVLSAVEMQRLEQLAVRLEGELSARAAATLGRDEMRAFLLRVWQENPVLPRLSRARGLSGEAQQRELISILEAFETQTGVDVQFVETGVVQSAGGTGNFASLRSRPGVLQIERQVLGNTGQLLEEMEHEFAFYYSGTAGRVPALGETGFNALELLELMIQGGGRLPPPVAP